MFLSLLLCVVPGVVCLRGFSSCWICVIVVVVVIVVSFASARGSGFGGVVGGGCGVVVGPWFTSWLLLFLVLVWVGLSVVSCIVGTDVFRGVGVIVNSVVVVVVLVVVIFVVRNCFVVGVVVLVLAITNVIDIVVAHCRFLCLGRRLCRCHCCFSSLSFLRLGHYLYYLCLCFGRCALLLVFCVVGVVAVVDGYCALVTAPMGVDVFSDGFVCSFALVVLWEQCDCHWFLWYCCCRCVWGCSCWWC